MMTYKDFKEHCNERACDGAWGFDEAITCLDIITEIEKVKVKGLFFRKRRTTLAKEEAFIKLMSKEFDIK